MVVGSMHIIVFNVRKSTISLSVYLVESEKQHAKGNGKKDVFVNTFICNKDADAFASPYRLNTWHRSKAV